MKPIVLAVLALVLPAPIFAATATLFSVADTTISPNDEALATGSTDTMITGHLPMPGVPARALLKFDLTSLPPGAVVSSAAVEVTASVVANGLFADTHLLHRVTQDWTEAGAGWGETGVGGGGWDNAGGDFDPAADASLPVGGTGTYTFSSTPALVATVQAWAGNAATNFGWVLRSAVEEAEGTRTGRRFKTREAAADHPKLVVTYTVPPPSVTLTNARVEGGNFRFEFTAQPGSSYTVQHKSTVNPGPWTTLSTHPAPPSPTVISVQDPLTSTNRFYRVTSP